MNCNEKKCVLICAGELPAEDKEEILRMAYDGDYFIAVDGGADYCREMYIVADLYMGDFDSISNADLSDVCVDAYLDGASEFPEIITLPREKDDTDTLAALKKGMELGFKEFVIFAGCGGRLDHTLANIQCLTYLKRNGANGKLRNGAETLFVLKNEEISFDAKTAGTLSLFSLNGEAKGVSVSGMKYNLEGGTLTNDFPIGISNEFVGNEARVSVADGEVLVVLRSE